MAASPYSSFYIPVPHPTLQLVLTPPRESDGDAVTAGLNHPTVYMNLMGPPFPYAESDWATRYATISENAKVNLADLEAVRAQRQSGEASSQDWTQRKWVGARIWTSTIREITNDNAAPIDGRYVGDIGVQRETFAGVLDPDEKRKKQEWNDSLAIGDPRIVWMIGFWLKPEYHRKGITAACLRQLMDQIIIPHMNAHTILGGFFEHNSASRRVFEKCGFSFEGITPDAVTINPAKINGVEGQKVGIGTMRWERKDSQ